jgi:hypothetical protein
LLPITVFSRASRTFASHHPPSCSGINSPRLFTPTFDVHRVLSSKTTLMMPPRRMSQRLHLDVGPPQESTNNPSFHQPSTRNLPIITEDPEHPSFEDIPKVQHHQPAHISTTAIGPNQNSGSVSSTQTCRGAPCQSPLQAPSLVHMAQGDAELDQVQIHVWDEEAKEDEAATEEEELARVQEEIERIRRTGIHLEKTGYSPAH